MLKSRYLQNEFKGIWIRREGNTKPDIVVYYIHGKEPGPPKA